MLPQNPVTQADFDTLEELELEEPGVTAWALESPWHLEEDAHVHQGTTP